MKCEKCNGRGFFEGFSPMGDGLEYRDSCGWCKGTGIKNGKEKCDHDFKVSKTGDHYHWEFRVCNKCGLVVHT